MKQLLIALTINWNNISQHWIMRTTKALMLSAIVAVTLQPGISSAQTSGIGADAKTRLLWRGADGSISLWRLDPSLNFETYKTYGPYSGWTPVALTTAGTAADNNNTYVLWRYSTGAISLWSVDSNLNYVGSVGYGPYADWTAETLSVATRGPDSSLRIIWRNTNGAVSVWAVNSNLNLFLAHAYGPFVGWDPGPFGGAAVTRQAGAKMMPRDQSFSEAKTRAAASMKAEAH
jgi:hypothetical protein